MQLASRTSSLPTRPCRLCAIPQRPTGLRRTLNSQPSQAYLAKARRHVYLNAEGAEGPTATTTAPTIPEDVDSDEPEVTFLETNGSDAELAISLVLGLTLLYAPLTIASLGRRAWIKTTFTNKRLIVTNTSPLFKNTVQVAYDKIKEIRSASKAFGLWGDMVFFLKDGARLEMAGVPRYDEVRAYIEGRIVEMEAEKNRKKVDGLGVTP